MKTTMMNTEGSKLWLFRNFAMFSLFSWKPRIVAPTHVTSYIFDDIEFHEWKPFRAWNIYVNFFWKGSFVVLFPIIWWHTTWAFSFFDKFGKQPVPFHSNNSAILLFGENCISFGNNQMTQMLPRRVASYTRQSNDIQIFPNYLMSLWHGSKYLLSLETRLQILCCSYVLITVCSNVIVSIVTCSKCTTFCSHLHLFCNLCCRYCAVCHPYNVLIRSRTRPRWQVSLLKWNSPQ